MSFTPAQAADCRAHLRNKYKSYWQKLTAEVNEDITSFTDAKNSTPFTMQEFVLAHLKNAKQELHLIAYLNNFGPRAKYESFLAKYTKSATEYVTALEESVQHGLSIHIDDNVAFEEAVRQRMLDVCTDVTAVEEAIQQGAVTYKDEDGVYRTTDGCLNEAEYKEKVDDKMKMLRMYQNWGAQYTARGLWRN